MAGRSSPSRSIKGGSGKTTTAVNLAATLRGRGYRSRCSTPTRRAAWVAGSWSGWNAWARTRRWSSPPRRPGGRATNRRS
uniref:nucleotide-binding protein n=1 Tax=Paracoccus mutanolyticus TaxID=1499308 RepID=UPI0037C9584E